MRTPHMTPLGLGLITLLINACTTGVEITDAPSPDDLGALPQDPSDATADLTADPRADQGPSQGADLAHDQGQAPDQPSDQGRSPDLAQDANPDQAHADQGPLDERPTLYAPDQLLSPVTPSVARAMRQIAARHARRQDVFMKVGASGTVSARLVHCFAPSSTYQVELGEHGALRAAIDHFNGGDAAGSSPFNRVTLAAQSGRSATWAISGSPSPLRQELQVLNPRFALVNYGTNDMGQGSTYQSAMFPFYDAMTTLLDELTSQGVVPIITGLNPRADSTEAARWVPAYNALTRGLAQARQLPYLDLYLASKDLPNQGLVSDGIHGNAYTRAGKVEPCVFTEDGLAFNYNVRNLLTLRALDAAWRVVALDEPGRERPEPLQGQGAPDAPWRISALPFAHSDDTSRSEHALIDAYPSCDAGQDESGPERYYRLTLTQPTALRMMVFDSPSVDVDLHLLDAQGDPTRCVARHDRVITRTLPAGEHTIVVDTFVSRTQGPRQGPYTLLILACEPGDPSCR